MLNNPSIKFKIIVLLLFDCFLGLFLCIEPRYIADVYRMLVDIFVANAGCLYNDIIRCELT